MEDDQIIKLNLRMPSSLYDRLGARAMKNRRSLNNEIVIILERLVSSEESIGITGKADMEKTG